MMPQYIVHLKSGKSITVNKKVIMFDEASPRSVDLIKEDGCLFNSREVVGIEEVCEHHRGRLPALINIDGLHPGEVIFPLKLDSDIQRIAKELSKNLRKESRKRGILF